MPSPGVTPKIVYPFVAEVGANEIHASDLHFIEINDLKNRIDTIQESHWLITAGRLIHSLDQELQNRE